MIDEIKLRQTIADNLIYYRKRAGLTQAELAASINYSDKSISKWERGDGIPDVIVLSVLADCYQIGVSDLLSKRESPLEGASSDDSEGASANASEESPACVTRGLSEGLHVDWAAGMPTDAEFLSPTELTKVSGATEAPEIGGDQSRVRAEASEKEGRTGIKGKKAGSGRRMPGLRARILVPILSVGLAWLAATFLYFLMKVISPSLPCGAMVFTWCIPVSCIVLTVFAQLWWHPILRFASISGIEWSVAAALYGTFLGVPGMSLIFAVAGVMELLTVLWFVLRLPK